MAWSYLERSRPFGFAHRGGRGGAPENTAAAFSDAVELGYRYLETDVHTTADGVLVAFHDDDLERVAGLPGGIGDYGWDQLSHVRLTTDDGADEGDAENDVGGDVDGHAIPQLTELLERFPEARFNIDPKADDAVDLLIEVIRDHDAIDRVCVGSFSDQRVERVQQALGPRLCTSPGPKGVLKVVTAAKLGRRWTSPYGCLQIPVRGRGMPLDSARLIKQVHSLGMQVHFWTINDADEMIRLLDRGADAIITDEIELLKDVLSSRGHRV